MNQKRIVFNIIIILLLSGIAVFDGIGFFIPDVSYLKTSDPQETAMMKFRKIRMNAKGIIYVPLTSWKPVKKIPRVFQKAVIFNEDTRFYQHNGVDWYEFRTALEDFFFSSEELRGASTITQQVAKNLYLNPGRHFVRKVKEFWIAKSLEKELSKKRILELYLNIAEWGPGIFGCDAAAQYWYHTNINDLNLYQYASLAAMLPSPLNWSPLNPSSVLMQRIHRTYEYLESIGFSEKSKQTLVRPLEDDSSKRNVSKQLQEARKTIDAMNPDSLIP